MWNGWMERLANSYGAVLDHQSAGRTKEAAAEFRANYLQVVKKVFTEAPQTYPTRFSKINDWCTWVAQLYVMSVKTDTALAGNSADSAKLLEGLRQHFYNLHKETQTLSVSDAIYAFRTEAIAAQPSVEKLKSLKEAVEKAPTSAKARLDGTKFTEAKAKWATVVDAAIADGKVPALREATETFYRAYGIQPE